MRKHAFILAAMLLGSIGLHAENKITYESWRKLVGGGSYGIELDPGMYSFCAKITDHSFSNGKGTITCDGDITCIRDQTFMSCGMSSINLPNTLVSIEGDAFAGCHSLGSITLPNSLKTIGSGAFRDCWALGSITIPNSVTSIGSSAFWICQNLTSATLPNSITSISNNLFDGCSRLSSITIPASVTSIGSGAFRGCSSLTSITIPNSVTSIGNDAFNGCSGLQSVTVPAAVTNIGNAAFAFCKKVTAFAVGANNTHFCATDGVLFNYAKSELMYYPAAKTQAQYTVPASVTSINYAAFASASSLTSVIIPASVTNIGNSAFEGCSSLKTIECYAFNPPSLGADAFKNVPTDGLSVWVYNAEEYIEKWKQLPPACFKQIPVVIDGIKYAFFDGDKAQVVDKEGGYTGNVVIPQQITYEGKTFTVTQIGQSAFKDCTNLTSVTFPNSITSIGMDAFWRCANLTSVTIPSSVTEIGQSAFFETGLTAITIPVSVKQIGQWAFKNCTKLTNLQFDNRTDAIGIGNYAFENLALTEAAIPDWLTVIPEGLFYGNKHIETVYLPASVKKINNRPFGGCPLKYIISMSETPIELGENAFEGYDHNSTVFVYVPSYDATVAYKGSQWGTYFTNFVTNVNYTIISETTAEVKSAIPVDGRVDIPTTATLLGNYYNVIGIADSAFYDEDSLVSISLPPSIQYIGNCAFCECGSIRNINIGFVEDLRTIGDKAFFHTILDSIVIPEGVQSLGKAAFSYNHFYSVSLPTGLNNIPDECFCKSFLGTEIIVPEGVKTIGTRGFLETVDDKTLTRITLPSTLTEIKDDAFKNRNALKEVICLAPNPPTLGVGVFTNKKTAILYVPNRDVMKTYQNSSWKNYNFNFVDLMAEENKQYLRFVAGSNAEALEIANNYCDSIDRRATSAQQVEYYTNIALVKIDKYTLNDYKIYLARQLDSIAAGNTDAERIADDYRLKLIHALFRDDAEKLFAEGLAKIKAIWDLANLKTAYCDNLKGSARLLGEDMIKVANDYCSRIQRATSKQEADKIYKEGAQEIARYVHRLRYWSGSPDKTCQTTKGYQY